MLPIVLSIAVLSVLFILVCVVAALLLLWRCYCAKHHKHNTTALGEGTYPPPLKETGQALHSVAVPDKEEEKDMEGYTIIPQLTAHLSQPHSQEDKGFAEVPGGEYAAISTPDPQSVYTQVPVYAAISTPDPQSVYTQVPLYAAITNPDPQSVYTQVPVYAAITNPDPQSVYTQVPVHAAITSPAPQSVYTQVDRKKSKGGV